VSISDDSKPIFCIPEMVDKIEDDFLAVSAKDNLPEEFFLMPLL
jgi:hypothetical protein